MVLRHDLRRPRQVGRELHFETERGGERQLSGLRCDPTGAMRGQGDWQRRPAKGSEYGAHLVPRLAGALCPRLCGQYLWCGVHGPSGATVASGHPWHLPWDGWSRARVLQFPHTAARGLQDLYLRRLRLQEGPALRRAAAAAGRRRVRPPRLG